MYSLKDITLDDIELEISATDWEDAIKKAARRPIEKGMFTKKYIEAMISSVKDFGPYIVLAKHVALAHARPEDGVLETGLYFTTLKKAVVFHAEDFDPVKLLIVLSAKDSESHIGLLSELSTILADEDNIISLMNETDPQAFLNKIKEAI